MTDPHFAIFKHAVKNLNIVSCIESPPLQGHPQVQLILDTTSRHKRHHIFIEQCNSEIKRLGLLQAVAGALQTDKVPVLLKGAFFYYFDIDLLYETITLKQIKQAIEGQLEEARQRGVKIIFALNQLPQWQNQQAPETVNALLTVLYSLLDHDQCRFIVFDTSSPAHLKNKFNTLQWMEPDELCLLGLLKSHRAELEAFHQVIFAEETFSFALSMANHYLSSTAYLDKAYELLDSGAARARVEGPHQNNPMVTIAHLTQIVSSWSRIPLPNLQNNKFQAIKFVEALQQTIFGQDAALQTMGPLLQNACIKLKKKPGPLCRFLLAGPPGTGKAKFAYAMADYLFGHPDALLRVHFNPAPKTWADIMVMSGREDRSVPLLDAIQKAPYSIILIENIEKLSNELLTLFKNILLQGHAVDGLQNKYDFQNAIFVLTTTLGGERLSELTKTTQEKMKPVDLMQLVLNNQLQDFSMGPLLHLTTTEVRDELMAILTNHFSADFLQQVDMVPFIPLDYEALEKIISLTLKSLVLRLETSFKLELHYSSEIIKFLSHEALHQHRALRPLDSFLEQALFSCIGHEIMAYHENSKIKSRRLVLKLNDQGNVLRCDFMNSVETPAYQ